MRMFTRSLAALMAFAAVVASARMAAAQYSGPNLLESPEERERRLEKEEAESRHWSILPAISSDYGWGLAILPPPPTWDSLSRAMDAPRRWTGQAQHFTSRATDRIAASLARINQMTRDFFVGAAEMWPSWDGDLIRPAFFVWPAEDDSGGRVGFASWLDDENAPRGPTPQSSEHLAPHDWLGNDRPGFDR